jgi:hypothetical protein
MHGADLHQAFALGAGEAPRQDQGIVAVMAPDAIILHALAGFVLPLDEVVVHVGGRRARHLDIDIGIGPRPRDRAS